MLPFGGSESVEAMACGRRGTVRELLQVARSCNEASDISRCLTIKVRHFFHQYPKYMPSAIRTNYTTELNKQDLKAKDSLDILRDTVDRLRDSSNHTIRANYDGAETS